MPLLPARASCGDPAMTRRRLPDRPAAHVRRRPGQTRCCCCGAGGRPPPPPFQPEDLPPHAAEIPGTPPPPPGTTDLRLTEVLTSGSTVYIDRLSWSSSASSSSPSPSLARVPSLVSPHSEHCVYPRRFPSDTHSTDFTDSATPIDPCNVISLTCACKPPSLLPARASERRGARQTSSPYRESAASCDTRACSSLIFETGRTTVFPSQRRLRSHPGAEVLSHHHGRSRCPVNLPHRLRPCLPSSVPSSLARFFLVPLLLLLLPSVLLALPAGSSKRPSSLRRGGSALEQPNHLILKTPLCQPVTMEDLRRMMGPAFDESRMAPDMAAAKRKFMSGFQGDDPRVSRVAGEDEFVEGELLWPSDEEEREWEGDVDDDDEGDIDKDIDGDENVFVRERELEEEEEEEDIYSDKEVVEDFEEEEEEEEVIRRRPVSSWEVREARPASDEDISGVDYLKESWAQPHKHRASRKRGGALLDPRDPYSKKRRLSANSYAYMKKRRRKRSSQSWRRLRNRDASSRPDNNVNSRYNASSSKNNTYKYGDSKATGARRKGRRVGTSSRRRPNDSDGDDTDGNSEGDPRVKKSSSSKDGKYLPLRIAVASDKKLRRKLKKQFRQRTKNLKQRPPPWECKLKSKTLIMNEGIFPRVLVDGRCATSKCFYRLYDCEPFRYNIKLMQRDPNHCNPLPTISNTTMFEERWNLISRQITVGCNCANASTNKRRKSRNRGWSRSPRSN